MDCIKCKSIKDGSHASWCKKCYAEWKREYRKRKPEKAREANRRSIRLWREKYPDKWRALIRRKFEKRVVKGDICKKIRIAWMLDGDVTREELVGIFKRDNGNCTYCGTPVKCAFTPLSCRGFDHVLARCNGGRHTASNMVVCCKSCNRKKGHTEDLELKVINGKLS